jgi:Fe-S-cluster containining protein
LSNIRKLVRELYADVDAAVAAAGPQCDASGRCCRFKEWGHVLYLSQLEADVLLSEAPPYQPPVSPDFCPFQKDNLCTAREPRPLGCRIYFCDPAYQETGNRIMESALSKLKQLAREHDLDWRYAPLHVFLNESTSNAIAAEPCPPSRIPLAVVPAEAAHRHSQSDANVAS